MRYIGSKTALLGEIASAVKEIAPKATNFTDLFAGTGSVGEFFKPSFDVVSNDILYFCYVINAARIQLSETPGFEDLSRKLGKSPIDFLNELEADPKTASDADFILTAFSPAGETKRMYLTPENALQIDRVRQTLEVWSSTKQITQEEYLYLLASLVESIPSYSNIAGTYGAYLKHWDSRALKRFQIQGIQVQKGGKRNVVFNRDASELITELSGEVLYLDTPYNGRQYSSNYHLLETVARYDSPELRGKTGTRNDQAGKSDFCSKSKVYGAFEAMFQKASFDHIVVSYSSEGLLSEEELVDLLKKHGSTKSLVVRKIPYRRYKRVANDEREHVLEYVFAVSK
jgi:adenine-specific DNA-methyltransferase